jgi:hypothetical protein
MHLSPRTLAFFGFIGTIMDVMGGIYLTYDLLGGRDGPLSLLTRVATYTMIFAVCYGLVLGPVFGLLSAVGLGTILALEFHRLSRHQRLHRSSPLHQTPWFSLGRGLTLGAAAALAYGLEFGALFGAFSAMGLLAISWLGMTPSRDYVAHDRLHMTRHKFVASVMRGLAIGLSGAAAAWIETANAYSVEFGLLVGGTVGLGSMILTATSPMIEYWIDNMPERHLVLMGLVMVFLGFALQSIQYLVVILATMPGR